MSDISIKTVTESLFGSKPIVAVNFKTTPWVGRFGKTREVDATLFLMAEARFSEEQLNFIAKSSRDHIRELVDAIPYPGHPVSTEDFRDFNNKIKTICGDIKLADKDGYEPIFKMCQFNSPLH